MRAITSPRRTSAPSWGSAQVTTPSRSDLAVARSSRRRASTTSLSIAARSSPRPVELEVGGALRVDAIGFQLEQRDVRLLHVEVGLSQRVPRHEALIEQPALVLRA